MDITAVIFIVTSEVCQEENFMFLVSCHELQKNFCV